MSRPNLLLIFTDQQRFDTLHAWGNPIIKTPALDRIAREGVLFDAAYTPSPVCVPARCALIHGQYASRTGCDDNDTPMPTDRPTFMQALTQAGYRTHGIGKMHFVPDSQALRGFQTRERSEEVRAHLAGDDYLEHLRASGYDHVYDPMGPRGEMYYVPQPAQMPARLHNTQWVGDRSVAFLQSQNAGGQPFMLFTSFIHPHPPFSPPTPWNKLYRAPLMPLPKRPPDATNLHTYVNRIQNRYKYRDAGLDDNLLRCMKAYYYGCISFIDYQIGRMLQTLEQRNLLDDTLILFTSDHGEFLGDYDCFGKRSMLDVVARIPMLARLPGRYAQGQRCDVPTSLVDVMPTLLATAEVDAQDMTLDGLDLAEVARGGQALQDRTVYSQFQHGAEGLYMALNRRYKYAYSAPDRREYLFDREQDPQETRNRAENVFCGQAVDEMRARLMATYREHGVMAPFDGNAWRLYPQPQVSRDPDAGLLIQDPGWSRAYQHIPGYSD